MNVPHPVNFHMVALSAPAYPIFLQLWPQFPKLKLNLGQIIVKILCKQREKNTEEWRHNVGLDVRVSCDFHSNFPRYVVWHSCVEFDVLCLCCCAAALPVQSCWCEAACCMLFRPSHIVSRSEPAVNTDTYIHMHRLHAGRYLFKPQRHMIAHSTVAHTQYEERAERIWMYVYI